MSNSNNNVKNRIVAVDRVYYSLANPEGDTGPVDLPDMSSPILDWNGWSQLPSLSGLIKTNGGELGEEEYSYDDWRFRGVDSISFDIKETDIRSLNLCFNSKLLDRATPEFDILREPVECTDRPLHQLCVERGHRDGRWIQLFYFPLVQRIPSLPTDYYGKISTLSMNFKIYQLDIDRQVRVNTITRYYKMCKKSKWMTFMEKDIQNDRLGKCQSVRII